MHNVIALAGNPNVGKSTVFNALTGLNQHTGNWPGKTVESARGTCTVHGTSFELVDLPGCYSLLSHSEEEEVSRDFICFQHPDAVIVVCDATCLERNLDLCLQVLETTPRVILCVNLMDEARRKRISVDLPLLSSLLRIPVVGTAAGSRKGMDGLLAAVFREISSSTLHDEPYRVVYPEPLEKALQELQPLASLVCRGRASARWVSLRLLAADESFLASSRQYWHVDWNAGTGLQEKLRGLWRELADQGYDRERIQDAIAEAFVRQAETISNQAVTFRDRDYDIWDRRLDRLFTSSLTGFPIMCLLLMLIFWITITGANIPSDWLARGFSRLQDLLLQEAFSLGIPPAVYSPLIFGVYRVLTWVISVMLPPMAIIFPLFTLLEDFGYLPRVAFNLDRCFQKCNACGKQALTMCMGFGCNAAGVTGCRIIDSPRERLIAILTNNFVPCNGRFPTIIAVSAMFLTAGRSGAASLLPALSLTIVIVLGVLMTLLVSKLLSVTLLKGVPSSFTLELPPYRIPQFGRVIIRSIFDRTIFVLARSIVVAAPAGLVIWILANVDIGGTAALAHLTGALDPFARFFGLDGVILAAFILGMPANEIVLPVMLMTYLAQGSLLAIEDLDVVRSILSAHGWTWVTAVNVILFSLMHWPCGTTCLTIRKETRSFRWMLAAILIPAIMGLGACFLFTHTVRLVRIFL